MIGEDPAGIPNNLLPYISQVATGRLDKLKIFGNNYPTLDGTGIRDYIHVVDLAKGHISALNYLASLTSLSFGAFNLGTGEGKSVLEMIHEFEKASGKLVPFEVVDERNGDVAECWASTEHAQSVLGWKAHYGISQMCKDAWRWQSQNPNGYELTISTVENILQKDA
jgi:UDP-glucose 4-epimerase